MWAERPQDVQSFSKHQPPERWTIAKTPPRVSKWNLVRSKAKSLFPKRPSPRASGKSLNPAKSPGAGPLRWQRHRAGDFLRSCCVSWDWRERTSKDNLAFLTWGAFPVMEGLLGLLWEAHGQDRTLDPSSSPGPAPGVLCSRCRESTLL